MFFVCVVFRYLHKKRSCPLSKFDSFVLQEYDKNVTCQDDNIIKSYKVQIMRLRYNYNSACWWLTNAHE